VYSIDDLKTFQAIAEMGGVKAGARRLGVSGATASHRLAKLEAALRVTLFHRNSRSLHLSEGGRVFFDRIQPILADLAQAERDAGSSVAALSGTLRVTMSPWILSRFVLPALSRFQQAHPKVIFEVLAVDRFVPLSAEGQDCGIRVGQLEDSAMVATKLADNQRVICCAPSFLDRHGTIRRTDDLIDAPWVTLPWQRRFAIKDKQGRRQDLTVFSNLMVSNSDLLTEGAIQGLGLAIKSRLAIEGELEDGRLVEVLPDALWEPSAPIWFVYPREARVNQKAKLFGEMVSEAFGALRKLHPSVSS